MIVLDTNIISEIMRPKPEPRVMGWLRKQPLSRLATTAVSVAEIRYGLGCLPNGRRKHHLQAQFQSFLARGFRDRILAFDAAAAEAYSVIVVEREKAGRSIDAFDAMIAAIARTVGQALLHGMLKALKDVASLLSIHGIKNRRAKMIPEKFKNQVAESELQFEAYLPSDLASWVVELVEQGAFTSPSEAVFVAMQTFRELDRHPEIKNALLGQMLADAEKDIEKGNIISHEEVIAELERSFSQKTPTPVKWDQSMDKPFFVED